MKRAYILPIVFAAMLGGCTKNLEFTPISTITKEKFFKSENDVQGALNGMYSLLRNEAILNLFIWGEARSEVMTGSVAGSLGYEKYYNNTMTAASGGPGWGGLYGVINAANLILTFTPDISFLKEETKNDALAQAYTMRAYAYFLLGRMHGGVPIRLVPMEKYDPLTIQVAKSTEAEIFQLIKADLDKALSLFPTNNIFAGRSKWSKPAANALKGDVYLWTGKRLNGGSGDFTVALTALQEVGTAANVGLLANFADIFKYGNKTNTEMLMSLRFAVTETAQQTYAFNMYASTSVYPPYVPKSTIDSIGIPLAGNGNVWSVREIVRSQFTMEDKRRAATFIELKGPGANQYYTNYGLKNAGTVESGVRYFTSDYILYRYADVLLMIAEAKNALGQDPTTEMTLIRQRGYGADYPGHEFVSGSQEVNDAAILKERLLELALEGKRWYDLVRFGKAFDLVPSLTGKQADTWLLYWPITIAQTTRETLVTEIPGWK